MDIDEIVDQDSLRAWLLGQPREVSVRVAHREAMRVLPEVWRRMTVIHNPSFTVLPVLRCNLIAAVASYNTTSEVINFAVNAEGTAATLATNLAKIFRWGTPSAVTATGQRATGATSIAAMAVTVATSLTAKTAAKAAASIFGRAGTQIWVELQNDCRVLGDNAVPECWPLWAAGDNLYLDEWREVFGKLDEDWAFWRDWYQDALDGVEPDWEMLEEIALIAPEVWEQGPEVVNGVIAEIVEKYENGGNALRGKSAQEVLSENARVIRSQFDTMVMLIEDEILRVHGVNQITDEEAERIGARVDMLREIIERLKDMLAALEDGAGRALVVIEDQLPLVVEAAEGLDGADEAPRVSRALITMAASVKCLTDAGVPGMLATGMAGVDIARVALGNKFKRSKSKDE